MKIRELLENLKDVDVDLEVKVEVFKSGHTWKLMELDFVELSPDKDEVRLDVSYWGR